MGVPDASTRCRAEVPGVVVGAPADAPLLRNA
jgi:hypothetical protein